VFYIEFDKLVSWMNAKPKSIHRFLNKDVDYDIAFVGRTKKAWATYPDSWTKTELIAVELLSKINHEYVDAYAGPFVANSKAIKVLIENAEETSWGSISEYLLIALDNGLDVRSIKTSGLIWEDPYVQADVVKEIGREKWEEKYYNSISEWEKRTNSLLEQLRVIKRFQK